MADTKIKSSNITGLAVTHDKLHTDMNLTSKTVQVATPTADTHPATKNYVDTEVANLIDSAPGTLDTLNELAAAIGDDANFAATVTTGLSNKLPLAGGTMTGVISNFESNGIDDQATSNVLTILSNGSVGIGATGSARFTLSGTASANDLSSAMVFALGASTKLYLGASNATNNVISGSILGDATFRTNGGSMLFSVDSGTSSAVKINSSGDVGIGTNDPVGKLEVNDGTGNTFRAIRYEDHLMEIGNYNASDGYRATFYGSNEHRFMTATAGAGSGSVDMTITDGKVGIGTASPVYKFHINQPGNSPQLRISGNANWDFYSYNDNNFYLNNSAGTVLGLLANKDAYFGKNLSIGDSVLSTYHANYPALDIGSSASVQGYTGNNGVWLQSNLFMNTNGQWTSKSDDYSAMLELYDGNFNFYNTASGTGTRTLLTPMTIKQNGNVGIGEDAPEAPLDFGVTSTNQQVLLLRQNGNSRTGFGISNDYGVRVLAPHDVQSAGSLFGVGKNNGTTYSGDLFTVQYGGNVGIGTTAPSEQLHIFNNSQSWNAYARIRLGTESSSYEGSLGYHRGTISDADRGLYLSGSGTTKHVNVRYNGSVGIGNNIPDYKLDVGGTTEIQGRFKSSGGTGWTQGAIVIESSDSTSNPGNRGQGVYMYNVPNQRTWYSGTLYDNGNKFGIGYQQAAGLQHIAADNVKAKLIIDGDTGVTIPERVQPVYYEPQIKYVAVTGGFSGGSASANTWYPITNQNMNGWNNNHAEGARGVNFLIKWSSGNVNRGYHHCVSGHIPVLSANSYSGYQNGSYGTSTSGTSSSAGLNINISHHTGCASGHDIQCRLWGDGTNYGSIYLQIKAEAPPNGSDCQVSFWKV